MQDLCLIILLQGSVGLRTHLCILRSHFDLIFSVNRNRLEIFRPHHSAQTRPLVDYYSGWAKADPANAPKYRAISGTGSVDEITARALQALAG